MLYDVTIWGMVEISGSIQVEADNEEEIQKIIESKKVKLNDLEDWESITEVLDIDIEDIIPI
jgi:hypothetical protein